MNKEEILAKSRKENEISDERTKQIKQEGANFSVAVLIILWVALSRFAPLNPVGQMALGLLVHVTCFANFAFQLAKNKSKTVIFFAIAFGATAILYIYGFFNTIGA